MYETPEMGSASPVSAETGRLFFTLYYEHPAMVPDAAFKRAAATWQKSISKLESFRVGIDLFVDQAVKTEPQFRNAWNGIANQAKVNNMPVWVGNVLSHASKDTSQDGLEFASVRSDGTISQPDIKALDAMPWDKSGYLILSGCNTGLLGAKRSWCPAQEFAQKQGVRTLGQTGYAYFSSNLDRYATATTGHTSIALWAYKRGKNGVVGSGSRMHGRVFGP